MDTEFKRKVEKAQKEYVEACKRYYGLIGKYYESRSVCSGVHIEADATPEAMNELAQSLEETKWTEKIFNELLDEE